MPASANKSADGDFDDAKEVKTTTTEETFENKVNSAVKEMTQDDKGLWVVPTGLSEDVAYAARAEKRRRDTQSALSKTTQELEATKSLNTKLQSKLQESFKLTLTPEQKDELEDLASTDPEAYRLKVNELEDSASEAFEEELSGLGYNADEISEMATRAQQLTDFLEDNSGLKLDDDVFENDLPPRITGKLARGEISFSDFLKEAKEYLVKGVTLNEEDEEDEPSLGKSGGAIILEKDIKSDIETSYKTEIY